MHLRNKTAVLDVRQKGDTIVEVLICIVISAAVIVGGYLSINRSYLSSEDTQERAQAVRLVETQIEDLRAAGGINPPNNCFSYSSVTHSVTPVNGVGVPPNNLCILQRSGIKALANSTPAYTMSIAVVVGSNPVTYRISAYWPSVLGQGNDSTSMEYRTQ